MMEKNIYTIYVLYNVNQCNYERKTRKRIYSSSESLAQSQLSLTQHEPLSAWVDTSQVLTSSTTMSLSWYWSCRWTSEHHVNLTPLVTLHHHWSSVETDWLTREECMSWYTLFWLVDTKQYYPLIGCWCQGQFCPFCPVLSSIYGFWGLFYV